MVQELRDQIAMLEGRADITPAALQILRADIARLTLQVEAGDTRMEDPRAKKIAPAIADPDGDGVLGENNATARGTVADSATTVAATADDLENPNRPGKGVDNDGSTDDFAVMPGGIGVMEEISIGLGDARDRLGMMDGTVDDENEFDIMADGTVDGFARNVHTRTNTADQSDTVTVFDNRDDPGDVPYREYYNDAQTDSDGDVVFDDEAILTTDPYDRDAVTEISEEGVLTIDTGATGDIAGNGKLFSATDFPSGDRVRYEYPADDVATEDVDESEARTFAGRFNGIPGEYSCTGTECSARNGMDGYLDLLIGAWEFTPDRVAKDADPHKIADAKFDADYLAFGYWLQGTGEGDKVKYGIGTFASGSMQFGGATPATPVALLVGTATYSGPAAGMFVMKTDINDDNMGPLPTEAGKFTAEAELTAKFGSTTATADDFTISGTVTAFEFENHDGRTFENKWSLPLNRATFATRTYDQNTGVINPTSFSAQANTFGGTTGAGDNLGRWEGGFYGPVVTEVEETAVEEAKTGYPTGVAGEFIGHFDGSDGGEVGHVIGAFGAPIDP
jgi:hypothetical protein